MPILIIKAMGFSFGKEFDKSCKIMPDSIALINLSTKYKVMVREQNGSSTSPQKCSPVFLSIGVHRVYLLLGALVLRIVSGPY